MQHLLVHMYQTKKSLSLLFVLSFIQLCLGNLLLPMAVLKMIFKYKVFATKLYAHKMLGLRVLRTFLESLE